MKAIEILLEDKLEHLAKTMGPKLLSAFERDTMFVTDGEEMTPEKILSILAGADPQGQKHLQWIAKLYANNIFRMEDLNRVQNALSQFVAKKRGLEKKDIGQYKTLADLEDAVEDAEEVKSKRQEKQDIKAEGADIIFESNDYTIIKLKTEAAACYYGKNTRWCTTGDQNNMFDYYNQDGPIYVILDHKINRKFQVHWESNQFMNERDEAIDAYYMVEQYPALYKTMPKTSRAAYDLAYSAGKPLPKVEPLIAKSGNDSASYALYVTHERFPAGEPAIIKAGMEDDYDGPNNLSQYMTDFIDEGERWPEAEHAIARHGFIALEYASTHLNGERFPEAEKHMPMEDQESAIAYARDILKRRWPQLEQEIITKMESQPNAVSTALKYANLVIKGRWEEAERFISSNGEASYKYAKDIIHGRFSQGETAMVEDTPHLAIKYANEILKSRFPKLERRVFKKSARVVEYMNEVIKPLGKRWPEFEEYMESGKAEKEMDKGFSGPVSRDEYRIRLVLKYSQEILEGRWPAMESKILKYPPMAVSYAIHIMKTRWPALEKVLFSQKNPPAELILKYGKKFIQGEWPAFEKNIDNSAALVSYATKIKKDRLKPEQEKLVKKQAKQNNMGTWDWYRDEFDIFENVQSLRKKAGL